MRSRVHTREWQVIVLCLALVLCSNCTNHQLAGSAPSASSQVQGKLSPDEVLLDQVRLFASADQQFKDAWSKLQSYERLQLIESLTRINQTLPRGSRDRVLIAFTLCNLDHEYETNRNIVVSASGKNPPYEGIQGEWYISLLTRLMARADKSLVKNLFAASAWTDGMASSELSRAYSLAISDDAEGFLLMLSAESQESRLRVLELLKQHTLNESNFDKVEKYLKGVPRSSKLASLAQATLHALYN